MDETSLDRWAAEYQAGQETRLQALVEALARPLLALAFRYVRDWDLAADLVQDAWLKIVARIESYEPGRSFAAWTRVIVRNTCLTHLRKVARLPRQVALEVAGDLVAVRGGDDPQQAVTQQELAWTLGRAIERLGATQREVFVRVAVEHEPRAAVAADLGLTTGHLRVVLHLARRRLASVLSTLEENP